MKILVTFSVLASVCAYGGTWDSSNDPSNFDHSYEYHFSSLPLKSTLPPSKTPWAGSYWPRFKGSINYRWNTPSPVGLGIKSPPKYRVQSMSREELAQLSPAEKFDLAQGHYNYPLSTAVAKGSKKNAKYYEGICDGWTASSIQFPEPKAVVVTNPDGLEIPFGSTDVKALMSYDVSINLSSEDLGPVFVGNYCKSPWGMKLGTPNCMDINPGAMHVILANEIGIKKEAFAVDIDPTHETWNQPVFGYEFEALGSVRVERAARGVIIRAKMYYTQDDPRDPEELKKVFSWDPTIGTDRYTSSVLTMDYILELDYADRIIGGTWLKDSVSNHPDLFWKPSNKIKFTEEFEILNKIYQPNF